MTPLVPRDARIGLIAPSHAFYPEPYATGRAWLEARGHTLVEVGLGTPHRTFAADDDTRLDGLVQAMTRPDLDAVWAIRGGSGMTRLLGRIPWDDLRPVPVLGFSDLTPLLNALALRGLPAIHGPVVHSLGKTDDASLSHLDALLAGEGVAPLVGRSLVEGQAEGRMLGGNLCLVAATCGTPWQLDATGALLVLEEIGEHPYKVDRMLQQLSDSGVLDGLAGVVLGTFTGCDPPSSADWTLDEIFVEHLAHRGVPVLADVPIGHGPENRAFVVGGTGVIRGERVFLGGGHEDVG